jgi:hypothetical protein
MHPNLTSKLFHPRSAKMCRDTEKAKYHREVLRSLTESPCLYFIPLAGVSPLQMNSDPSSALVLVGWPCLSVWDRLSFQKYTWIPFSETGGFVLHIVYNTTIEIESVHLTRVTNRNDSTSQDVAAPRTSITIKEQSRELKVSLWFYTWCNFIWKSFT